MAKARSLGTIILAAVVLLIGSAGVARAQAILKFAHAGSPAMSYSRGYDQFAAWVKERTNGRVVIEVYGAGRLALEVDAYRGVMQGNIEIASISSSNIGALTEALYLAGLPYVFKDLRHVVDVFNYSPIGEEIKARVGKELNVQVLMFFPGQGFRTVATARKAVRVPDDLKGLKMRATSSKVEIALLKAWGARPTPVSFAEVYTALQQGTVDGEYLQHQWVYFPKHHEVIKYIAEPNASADVQVVSMRREAWNKISPADQEVVRKSAIEAVELAYKLDQEQNENARAKLAEAGVKLYAPTGADLEQWKKKAMTVWDEFKAQVGPDMIKRVQAFKR
ncbi:MAG: TRAP transporter substrate-binding protein [Candidatus Rokubacteria bacterium]|nr:TRAP transporter substrate-binding protein [Candidatus Rokubacteria bacterium]